MSVVVRMPDGRIKLMVKGADTVIYERLAGHQTFAEVTMSHLDEFATLGEKDRK